MQNGDIKDDQITASSSRPADLPHYGRLRNSKYWCAARKSKEEYLQVDLGQVRTAFKGATSRMGNLEKKLANFTALLILVKVYTLNLGTFWSEVG